MTLQPQEQVRVTAVEVGSLYECTSHVCWDLWKSPGFHVPPGISQTCLPFLQRFLVLVRKLCRHQHLAWDMFIATGDLNKNYKISNPNHFFLNDRFSPLIQINWYMILPDLSSFCILISPFLYWEFWFSKIQYIYLFGLPNQVEKIDSQSWYQ